MQMDYYTTNEVSGGNGRKQWSDMIPLENAKGLDLDGCVLSDDKSPYFPRKKIKIIVNALEFNSIMSRVTVCITASPNLFMIRPCLWKIGQDQKQNIIQRVPGS